MPVFVVVGRRDHWVPPEMSVAYFDAVSAPSKTLLWFDHSGHEAFVDEPARFNAVLEERVRPLASRATVRQPGSRSSARTAPAGRATGRARRRSPPQ